MKEVASEAGILTKRVAGETQLNFISEPEAAALATLSDMEGRCDIKPGDIFVVVDCGGGTVDLISYEVTSTAPMAVKECVKGQGGLCGAAVFIDEAFLALLVQKFGQTAWDKMKAQSRQRLLHDEWEHGIKPAFDGRERTWTFNMPFECIELESIKPGSQFPHVTLTSDDVRGAFRPTVEKICSMVEEQVAAVRAKKAVSPKGDDMSAYKPMRFEIIKLYTAEDAAKTRLSKKVYTSTSTPPSTRLDDTVEKLCPIEWDAEIDITSLPTYTNPPGKRVLCPVAKVPLNSTGEALPTVGAGREVPSRFPDPPRLVDNGDDGGPSPRMSRGREIIPSALLTSDGRNPYGIQYLLCSLSGLRDRLFQREDENKSLKRKVERLRERNAELMEEDRLLREYVSGLKRTVKLRDPSLRGVGSRSEPTVNGKYDSRRVDEDKQSDNDSQATIEVEDQEVEDVDESVNLFPSVLEETESPLRPQARVGPMRWVECS
ncbi:hypothetical protein C8A03DRAFT_34593 [Achaetomium macrosporum]|uniref:Uncharacterized protein n=1 Tax=Achaetomium macrosporum TaxID=79813 RepID=A0AAN7C9F5_9PEZI|nr:hypothetical protein C8A03DRAFT_34593 [Achaetomium macrosporum]